MTTRCQLLIAVRGRGSSGNAHLEATCKAQRPFLSAGDANDAIRNAGEELAGKPVVLRGLERRSQTEVVAITEWTNASRQRCSVQFVARLLGNGQVGVNHGAPDCVDRSSVPGVPTSPTSPTKPGGANPTEKAIASDGCGHLGVEVLEFHAEECSSGLTFRTPGWPAWAQTATSTSGTLEIFGSCSYAVGAPVECQQTEDRNGNGRYQVPATLTFSQAVYCPSLNHVYFMESVLEAPTAFQPYQRQIRRTYSCGVYEFWAEGRY